MEGLILIQHSVERAILLPMMKIRESNDQSNDQSNDATWVLNNVKR